MPDTLFFVVAEPILAMIGVPGFPCGPGLARWTSHIRKRIIGRMEGKNAHGVES